MLHMHQNSTRKATRKGSHLSCPRSIIMLLLTEPTLFFWNHIVDIALISEESGKQAYLGQVNKWVQKVGRTKQSVPSKAPRSTASSRVTSNSKFSAISKITATSSAVPPPTSVTSLEDELEDPGFSLDTDDSAERKAAHILAGMKTVSVSLVTFEFVTRRSYSINRRLLRSPIAPWLKFLVTMANRHSLKFRSSAKHLMSQS
jgi:hypothetical protein